MKLIKQKIEFKQMIKITKFLKYKINKIKNK